jgi:hypothetical protein
MFAILTALLLFEANATAARLVELDTPPLEGMFDIAHLRAIHGHSRGPQGSSI